MLLRLLTMIICLTLTAACTKNLKPEKDAVVTPNEGKILVTENGMTLYTYNLDKTDDSCIGCWDLGVAIWPYYSYARHEAPSEFATVIKRYDGTKQWAINGNPLHTYRFDKKPGDKFLDGKGGWFIARERTIE